MADIRTVRMKDARFFMEGDEACRQYYKTDKLLFGTSNLPPGKTGTVDPGHKIGHEIFYVARGQVVCQFPNIHKSETLDEGDIVIIPPGEPHQLENPGAKEAVVIWSLAPPD